MPVAATPEDAVLEWGAPAQLQADNTFREIAEGIAFRVNDLDDTGAIPVFSYQERGRSTSQVRVENPDDANQYVIVERADSISFEGEGVILQLNFAHG